jgi:uncharacterized protein YjbI with pentapeptide repeats
MDRCTYKSHKYECDYESVENGLCYFHSKKPDKDSTEFKNALTAHRQTKGDVFRGFVFPSISFEREEFAGEADFLDAEFLGEETAFSYVQFSGDAMFLGTRFSGDTWFSDAKFKGRAAFLSAKFNGLASFYNVQVSGDTDFSRAQFSRDAGFTNVEFSGKANFLRAKFSGDAFFTSAKFKGNTDFRSSRFQGRTLFISDNGSDGLIETFSLTDPKYVIDFTDLIIEKPETALFRNCDLSRCKFLGTDLRRIEFTNVTWSRIESRLGVNDEILAKKSKDKSNYPHIEQLYRQLKQNYEDRKDYERARDFHYGEKEMRRRNPNASPGLRILLTIYWAVSGYGERYVRPLIWIALLVFLSTIGYILSDTEIRITKEVTPVYISCGDWFKSFYYTFRVMFHLKPDDFAVPVGSVSQFLFIIDSIFGPVLVGLFALAIRQRLKR